jgi:hypothetical protein
MDGVLTEIRIEHLPNTNLDHYCYANPLGITLHKLLRVFLMLCHLYQFPLTQKKVTRWKQPISRLLPLHHDVYAEANILYEHIIRFVSAYSVWVRSAARVYTCTHTYIMKYGTLRR